MVNPTVGLDEALKGEQGAIDKVHALVHLGLDERGFGPKAAKDVAAVVKEFSHRVLADLPEGVDQNVATDTLSVYVTHSIWQTDPLKLWTALPEGGRELFLAGIIVGACMARALDSGVTVEELIEGQEPKEETQ